jgi:hypothetical protein
VAFARNPYLTPATDAAFTSSKQSESVHTSE